MWFSKKDTKFIFFLEFFFRSTAYLLGSNFHFYTLIGLFLIISHLVFKFWIGIMSAFYKAFSLKINLSLVRFTILFCLSFLLCGSVFSTHATYSIEECVALAKTNNARIAIAQSKITYARAVKDEMRSALLPHVSLEGVWDNNNRSLSGDLTQFIDFRSKAAIGISTTWGLWDFGSSLKKFKASKYRIDASELQSQYTSLVVEEQVRTTYLSALENEKIAVVLESSIKTLKQQLATSHALFEQGLVKYTDVLTVQVQLSEEEKRLIQAKNEVLNRKMELNHLIGLPVFETILLQDIPEGICMFSYDHVFDYALQNRPDLLALRKQLEALKLDRLGVRLSVAPKLYAFANGNLSGDEAAISGGLGMKIDLYEGGQREAKLDRLDSEIRELSETLEDLNAVVAVDIKTVFLRLDEIRKSMEIDKEALVLAEKNLRDTMDFYGQGSLSINDVLISEGQLTFVKKNFYSSLYRSHMACARLVTLTGGLSPNF